MSRKNGIRTTRHRSRVNYNEIIAGRGTEHGGIWLDITNLSKEKILDRLPTMYEQFKNLAGIDISQEKMEVGSTAHYSMGGVVVNTIAVQKELQAYLQLVK